MAEINDMDLFKVDGLVAVITGGGTGLGLMMAKALAANGANKVYIVGRRLEKLEEAAKASPHGNIIPAQGDASSKESLGALAERVKKEVGYINLLVCNSGRSGPSVQAFPPDLSLSQIKERMWEWEFEDFNDVFKLNNTGTFFTAVAFLDLLDAGNKKGNRAGIDSQIVITASLAGLMRTLATGVAYGASKAAAVHMTKVLSTYFAPHGIRVNAICPGIFPSTSASNSGLSHAILT